MDKTHRKEPTSCIEYYSDRGKNLHRISIKRVKRAPVKHFQATSLTCLRAVLSKKQSEIVSGISGSDA